MNWSKETRKTAEVVKQESKDETMRQDLGNSFKQYNNMEKEIGNQNKTEI